MSDRQSARAAEIIAHSAAEFILREASSDPLITVIRAESDSRTGHVRIFVSIFPIEKARVALAYLDRQRENFSDYLKQHTHIRLPRIDFLLDNGEQPLGGPGGN